MSISGGPNIIKNGLVLYLDAADDSSYVSGSTVWKDISGNNLTGSLVNGVAYNTGSKGSVVFDGSDDYIDCGDPSVANITGSQLSVFAWVYRSAANSGGSDFRRIIERCSTYPSLQYSFVVTPNSGQFSDGNLLLDLVVNGNLVLPAKQSTGIIGLYRWYNVGAVFNGTTLAYYIDSKLDSSFSVVGNITSVSNAGVMIGKYRQGGYLWNGRFSQIQLYNRALSADEILQNFNSTKGRYNL